MEFYRKSPSDGLDAMVGQVVNDFFDNPFSALSTVPTISFPPELLDGAGQCLSSDHAVCVTEQNIPTNRSGGDSEQPPMTTHKRKERPQATSEEVGVDAKRLKTSNVETVIQETKKTATSKYTLTPQEKLDVIKEYFLCFQNKAAVTRQIFKDQSTRSKYFAVENFLRSLIRTVLQKEKKKDLSDIEREARAVSLL